MFAIMKGSDRFVSKASVRGMYTDNPNNAARFTTRAAAELEKMTDEHVIELHAGHSVHDQYCYTCQVWL